MNVFWTMLGVAAIILALCGGLAMLIRAVPPKSPAPDPEPKWRIEYPAPPATHSAIQDRER